jgi:hypothetical protein
MSKKHPADSKSLVEPAGGKAGSLGEHDWKKLELGDAMDHEHGQNREDLEEDIEEIDDRQQD